MRLLQAVEAFIAVLKGSAAENASLKTENATQRETINDLTIQLAETKGENTEAVELLEKAVDLNGPVDAIAQVVIDDPKIVTPTALENEAIGDPAVVTPVEVAFEAAKAILTSVAETEGIDADADELADETDADESAEDETVTL